MNDIYRQLTAQFRTGHTDTEKVLLSSCPEEWYYALSPERIDALESYPWSEDMDVLEVGADLGVYARLSARVRSFSIFDTDSSHKAYIEARFPDAGNLRVISVPEGQYDTVILSLLDKKDVVLSETLSTAASLLRENGRIIVIADNQKAVRFLAGAELSGRGTFLTLSKLKSLSDREGLVLRSIHYPLPGAGFARSIYSDLILPGPSAFRGISESYVDSRYILLDEEAFYGAVSEAGAFPELAPSFLAVYENAHTKSATFPAYVKQNRMRKKEYRIKTEIFFEEGGKRVRKTALTMEADGHIEGFPERAEKLSGGEIIPLSGIVGTDAYGRKYIEFPFVKGRSLGDMLAEEISSGRAPEEKIDTYLSFILHDPGGERNLDALFENILLSDGKYVLIDYEWVTESSAEPDFLKYRILKYWYEEQKSYLYAYEGEASFMEAFGIDGEHFAEYEKLEEKFQFSIRGSMMELEEKYTVPQKYFFTKEALAEVEESDRKIDSLSMELETVKKTLKKERETERLSQNHIKNIEHIVSVREETIERLEKENAFLRKHESVFSRARRALIERFDAVFPASSKGRALIHLLKDAARHPVRFLKDLSSGSGRDMLLGELLIGGVFREKRILHVPICADPLVSVVMPVFNEIGYTYASISSIIETADPSETPYEIIVADDMSTDATKEISRFIKGLKVSRNTENTGFLKNANQGAAIAKGKYIFFLNNDTLTHEGTLSRLVRRLESDENIGMAGSKLIYPDGRLQEAGGIIWSDGSGWNYGRGDDPEKPEYCYMKEVDYISGAAVMIERALFEEIGGFDTRYAPAYFEDSDLAFEVRKRGRKVVYEPASVVTHFEGISNGTNESETGSLKHYQLLNREKFCEKWKEELKLQEENTGSPDPFTARDRSRGKPVIVMIDHYIPTWDRDAGSLTTYQLLKLFISRGFNVKFVGDNFLRTQPYATMLMGMGAEVLSGDWYERNIYSWLKEHGSRIDFVLLERPHIAAKYIDFLREETPVKCFFYGHDLHFLRLMREYELSGDIEKLSEARYFGSLEFSVMEKVSMSYYPSEVEVEAILKEKPGLGVKAISGFMWDEFQPVPSREVFSGTGDLLFVGGMKHPPNRDAVKWFSKEVFPRVRKAYPDMRFLVAGSGADEEILSLHDPARGVFILGYVSEERLVELYRETRLIVVPLRCGAGVKGKVVEALYYHAAVVTTFVGAEGIPGAEDVMIVSDCDPESFANAITENYERTEKLYAMISSTDSYIRKNYSFDAAWEKIRDDFQNPERKENHERKG